MPRKKNTSRKHWETKLFRSTTASAPPIKIAKTSAEMAKNVEALEALRRVCYPELNKGLRLQKELVFIKKG